MAGELEVCILVAREHLGSGVGDSDDVDMA